MKIRHNRALFGSSLVLAVVLGCSGEDGPNDVIEPVDNSPNGSMSAMDADEMPNSGSQVPATARYQLTFESTWREQSHPTDFPDNAHFSPLIGITHNADVVFWQNGEIASEGIEIMAEDGVNTQLEQEMLASGNSENLIEGSGIPSPGKTTVEFTVSKDYPLVTLVTMVAPSPDWFIGVSGLSLMEDGDWLENGQVELLVYDAGTDNGTYYYAPNEDTVPKQAITLLSSDETDFVGGQPAIGTFEFIRLE